MPDDRTEHLTQFLMDYVDFAVPNMDMFEQAVYMYIYRHGALLGQKSVTIGFKSKLQDCALGLSNRGNTIAESVIYKRLKSLQSKGFIKIIGTTNTGTEIQLLTPDQIPNLIKRKKETSSININEINFFIAPYRELIVQRENNKCFYCLKEITENGHVIEHVISRPEGDNTYKNLVLSCRSCNNRKGDMEVNDFLRVLYRENLLSENEMKNIINELVNLKNGELKPDLSLLSDYSPNQYV